MKKKSKPRLAIDRETVKTLAELRTDKLNEVVGGFVTTTLITQTLY